MEQIKKQLDPELLSDNAYLITEEEVRVDFTEDQITEKKKTFFTLNKTKSERENLLTKFKELLNQDSIIHTEMFTQLIERHQLSDIGIKTAKKKSSELMKIINQGYEIVTKQLYGFDYQDLGRMAFYDEDGIFIYDRPLTQNEKQTKIKTINKTA